VSRRAPDLARRREPLVEGDGLAVGLLVYALMCGLLFWHVARLQDPLLSYAALAGLAALALVPVAVALVAGRAAWIASLCATLAVGIGAISDRWPTLAWPWSQDFFVRQLGGDVRGGMGDWFDITLPYTRDRYPHIREVVLIATLVGLVVFADALLVHRRPLLAIALSLLPFAVVSIVYSMPHPVLRSVAFLALALAIMALAGDGTGRERRRAPQALLVGGVVVALAATAAALPGVARGAFLPWRDWHLIGNEAPVNVQYVWDQSYTGLSWPDKVTEVMRVSSPQPSYWRAVVLGTFDGQRWSESPLRVTAAVKADDTANVSPRPSPPGGRAYTSRFQIEGLDEPHLMSGGQPISYAVPSSAGMALLTADGVAQTTSAPAPGARYAVQSEDVDPTPAQLRAAGTAYPSDVVRQNLTADQTPIPAFGTPGRDAALDELLSTTAAASDWRGWAAAYRKASAVTADALTPYDAVVRLESYLRDPRNFVYDEHSAIPPVEGAPLAFWFTHMRSGYCQMFSGTMAELLRLDGIPARVAEGFTSGTYDTSAHLYRVTDHDAHAWVEVYFPRYGWLPFDPTPTRALDTLSSSSSPRFDLSGTGRGSRALNSRQSSHNHDDPFPRALGGAGLGGAGSAGGQGVGARILLGLLVVACLLVLLLAVKRALVLAAYRARDPRRRAAACRADVASYALDQGLEIGPWMSHGDIADALARGFGVDASAWAAALDHARYAPPERAAAATREARTRTIELRRRMRRALTARDRIGGALSLRSVLAVRTGRLWPARRGSTRTAE
jgi:transglutaminase-like putative cysteine protease